MPNDGDDGNDRELQTPLWWGVHNGRWQRRQRWRQRNVDKVQRYGEIWCCGKRRATDGGQWATLERKRRLLLEKGRQIMKRKLVRCLFFSGRHWYNRPTVCFKNKKFAPPSDGVGALSPSHSVNPCSSTLYYIKTFPMSTHSWRLFLNYFLDENLCFVSGFDKSLKGWKRLANFWKYF